MKKMEHGRIILKAQLTNISPMGIGSGRDENSDRDVVKTEYAFDANGSSITLDWQNESQNKDILPFIPASSFIGKIFRQFDIEKYPEVKKYWGESEMNASFIDCSDILLNELPGDIYNKSSITEIRDGIRIDSAKGTVANGAKFDYELLAPGAKFDFAMIFRIENEFSKYEVALRIASDIARIIEKGFALGAKSAVGLGKMKGKAELFELDFKNQAHFKQWIDNEIVEKPIDISLESFLIPQEPAFEIDASFSIKNSLIIRSYSNDPKLPDATHLKSGGENILSGASIRGALRSRAERILNTIQSDKEISNTILIGLFGDMEKEEDEVTVKKNGYTIPSRVFVDEVPVKEIKEEIQTRIQIDRFTGGTVDGAMIEEIPLFPNRDKIQIKNLSIRVENAQPRDKGLILLLLKDLWTSDLPIGGEKSIGRGVLEGKNAKINDSGSIYFFPDILTQNEGANILQGYVDDFNDFTNYQYYTNRVETFKNRQK